MRDGERERQKFYVTFLISEEKKRTGGHGKSIRADILCM